MSFGHGYGIRTTSDGGTLRPQDLLAHTMHTDPTEGLGHRGKRADDVIGTGTTSLVLRPGAVLAARPGDQRFRAAHLVVPTAAARAAFAACRPFFIALFQRADSAQRRFRRARARFPGASDRAPLCFMHRFPGPREAAIKWLHKDPTRIGFIRRGRRQGAEHPGLLVPTRGIAALDLSLHVRVEQRGEPFACEIDHRRLALSRKLAAEIACHLDEVQAGTRYIREQRGRARSQDLLENQVVALQAEWVYRPIQRDVIEATKRQLSGSIELTLRQARKEFDLLRAQYVGRHRHNDRAWDNISLRRMHGQLVAPDDRVDWRF